MVKVFWDTRITPSKRKIKDNVFDIHWSRTAIRSPFKFMQSHFNICKFSFETKYDVMLEDTRKKVFHTAEYEIQSNPINQIFKIKEKIK